MHCLVRLAALATLTVTCPTDAHATQCAGTHPETEVVAPSPKDLPRDGGVVVGTVSKPGLLKPGAKPPPAPTVKVDGRDADATALAPGLVVYRAPAPAKRLTVSAGGKTTSSTLTDTYGTTLAAPAASSIVEADHPELVGTTTTVKLKTPVPTGAIAVVVYDRKHRARTWAPVKAGATSVTVYDDRLCRSIPPGTFEPAPGETVTLEWIDFAGRPSATSASLKVTR
jgi:hypothetical protein